MADEAESPEKKTINLSAADTKVLLSIMKNLKSDIQFDKDAVAEECGYKDANTVGAVWRRLKNNRLGITTSATPTKTATPGKKRKGGEEAGDDEEDVKVDSPTPSKKARKSKAKKEETQVKAEEGDEF